jgi:DHA2 family multidrug resistance protein-like MFS transporter
VEFVNMVIARQAGRREWISLAVLTIPCLLYAMDLTVLNLAVPQLSKDLQPSSTQLLWIVDIYGFMAAGSLVTMGTLGDRIGRRRLLLTGAAAIGAASVLAAVHERGDADRGPAPLAAGATVAPRLSLIRNMSADPRQRRCCLGVDHQLLGRRCYRAAAGRDPAGVVLVGICVPAGGAGDGAAAGARAAAAPRVP